MAHIRKAGGAKVTDMYDGCLWSTGVEGLAPPEHVVDMMGLWGGAKAAAHPLSARSACNIDAEAIKNAGLRKVGAATLAAANGGMMLRPSTPMTDSDGMHSSWSEAGGLLGMAHTNHTVPASASHPVAATVELLEGQHVPVAASFAVQAASALPRLSWVAPVASKALRSYSSSDDSENIMISMPQLTCMPHMQPQASSFRHESHAPSMLTGKAAARWQPATSLGSTAAAMMGAISSHSLGRVVPAVFNTVNGGPQVWNRAFAADSHLSAIPVASHLPTQQYTHTSNPNALMAAAGPNMLAQSMPLIMPQAGMHMASPHPYVINVSDDMLLTSLRFNGVQPPVHHDSFMSCTYNLSSEGTLSAGMTTGDEGTDEVDLAAAGMNVMHLTGYFE